MTQTEKLNKLRAFTLALAALDRTSIDGAEVQLLLESHDILEPYEVIEPCGLVGCCCDPGDTCGDIAPWVYARSRAKP